jgi:hypothetical protein
MRRLLIVGALVLGSSIGRAQAATITFEDVAADGMGSPGSRISGGFVFAPATHTHVMGAAGDAANEPDDGDASNGTQYLAFDDVTGPDPVTFSRVGGGPSLCSPSISASGATAAPTGFLPARSMFLAARSAAASSTPRSQSTA